MRPFAPRTTDPVATTMRVVVIGATGNIGSTLVERLARRPDVDVVAAARRLPAAEARLPGVDHRSVDIVTDDLDEVVRGADAVVHLAWAIQPMHDPRRTWDVNTGGFRRVLDALERRGVPTLVYASSIGAYPAAEDDRRRDESTPPSGLGHVPYSAQKACNEALLDGFEVRTGRRVVRLRPALVLQRDAGAEYRDLFLGRAGRLGLGALRALHAPIPLPRDLRFPVVASDDVAAAIERALDVPTASGAFNLAAEPPVRASDLAAAVGLRTVPIPWWTVRAAVRAGFAARVVPLEPAWVDMIRWSSLLDTERARAVLGWTATVDAPRALADAIAGVLAGAEGATPPLDR